MGKAPSFQFYTGDWLQDTRLLTPATRGIWIDMLCFMWRSSERGIIQGTIEQLSRLLSCEMDELSAAIEELGVTKVANVTLRNKNVTVSNRRMVRDEKQRYSARIRQRRHRNAAVTLPCNATVTVPSSSSSSSSYNTSYYKSDVTPLDEERIRAMISDWRGVHASEKWSAIALHYAGIHGIDRVVEAIDLCKQRRINSTRYFSTVCEDGVYTKPSTNPVDQKIQFDLPDDVIAKRNKGAKGKENA